LQGERLQRLAAIKLHIQPPAAAAVPPTEAATAAQPAAAAEDSLFIFIGPLHLSGPDSVLLLYIFYGINCVKKFNFGSGSGSASRLFVKHAFLLLTFSFCFISRNSYTILETHF
jgi:hypothetical protein